VYFNIRVCENVKSSLISPVRIILFSVRWPIVDRKVLEVIVYINKGSHYPVTYRDCLISEYTAIVIVRLHPVNKEDFQSHDFPVSCPSVNIKKTQNHNSNWA